MLLQFKYYWQIWRPELARHPRVWTLLFLSAAFIFFYAFTWLTAPNQASPVQQPASYSQQPPAGKQTVPVTQQPTVANKATSATYVASRPPPVPIPVLHDKTINSFRDPASDIELPELPEIIR